MKIKFNFKSHLLTAGVALFLLLSCSQEKYVGSLVDYPGEKEGKIKSYYETGELYEVGEFTNGKLNGSRIIHYPTGGVQIEETYKAGKFHGTYKKFHENGKLKIEGEYENEKMVGVWKTYYETETIKDEVTMMNNLENGPFKEYHENGSIKAIGEYKNGEFEQGILQLFDASATLVKKMECNEGICKTIWEKES